MHDYKKDQFDDMRWIDGSEIDIKQFSGEELCEKIGSEKEHGMTKDEIIREYYDYISIPEEIRYSHDRYMAEHGITEEDTEAYRNKLIANLSYTPFEKRDIVVKELIKPLLKEHGFKTGGNTWCRKITDSLKVVIHMEGYRFSFAASGAIFQLIISLFESKEKLKPQHGIGELSIDSRYFLPYYGMKSPLYNVLGYRIDGYRDYLPIDIPIDEVKEYFRTDLEKYILPELLKIESREDYEKMYAKYGSEKRWSDLDIRIAWFIQRVRSTFTSYRADGKDYEDLVNYKKELKLTGKEILDNLDLADAMRCNQDFTKFDAKPLLIKLANEE